MDEPTRYDGDPSDATNRRSGAQASGDAAEQGQILGRFVVIEKVGVGGMGEVYRAYDPTLQREVALKLVRTGSESEATSDRQQRTLREAQAMARISHPNVVPVFDAWVAGEKVCIAMEYVAGRTLGRWVADEARSVDEILAMYTQAGRGLAAAHGLGMVHRDFKPDNVIVDEDGRARVLDFGLARTVSEEEITTRPSEVSQHRMPSRLTRTGTVMGTPAYMAPEQHDGSVTEPAADQFAFCVALYEALYGHRPFAGETLEQIVQTKARGDVTPPPDGSAVPKRVRVVLERGMTVEPQDRWPSMEVLLEALARPRRSMGWWLAGIAGVTGLAILVTLSLGNDQERCSPTQSDLPSAWNEELRAETVQSLAAVDMEGEGAITGRVVAGLDEYFESWAAQYLDTCERTHVRRNQSATLMDRRMQCLDRRLAESSALVEVFRDADADVVARATRAVARLRSPLDCADVEALGREVELPTDPAIRDPIEALQQELGRARALFIAGRFDRGLTEVVALRERADAVGWGPLRSEALKLEGSFRERLGELDAAERLLTDAVWVGLESAADAKAADAAIDLAFTVGYSRGDPQAAAVWIRLARAIRGRLGIVEASADLESVSGTVAGRAGDYERALDHYRAAQLAHEREGADDGAISRDLSNIGTALFQLGREDEAREAYERSLVLKERSVGASHPSVATTLFNLGLVLANDDERLDEAARVFERSVAIRKKALGPTHPYVAVSMQGLGQVALRRGSPRQAIEIFERAREILERSLGLDHPDATEATVGIGNALRELGDVDGARREYEQALRVRIEAWGADHAEVKEVREELAALDEHVVTP